MLIRPTSALDARFRWAILPWLLLGRYSDQGEQEDGFILNADRERVNPLLHLVSFRGTSKGQRGTNLR